jgi:ferredoxin--NADP+ reductase
MDRYRVAVVGAGPSGLYAAAALLASGEPIDVDVLDRLPAPYGLVRYGWRPTT